MLSPADAALAARDPELPCLPLLLDDDALAGLLGGPVVRRYLRYKFGTSCVLAAVLPDGRDVAVQTVADDGIAKLDKTTARAPEGSVLLDLRGLLVTTPEADRDLPALRLLPGVVARLGLRPGPVRRLSWKPARRFVGLLGDDVVLRVHDSLAPLPTGLPGTVPVLGEDARLGLRALPFVPGRPLDEVLRAGPSPELLRRTGEAVARLHAHGVPGLAVHGDGLAAAAEQVGVLLPDLAEDALALADRLRTGTATGTGTGTGTATLHGDLSADQVVTDGTHVTLVDLDRLRAGAPADDLGSWQAAGVLAGLPDDDALREGYARVLPLPDVEELAQHRAAHLLRRAAEPFRTARPDWERTVRTVLRTAQEQLSAVAR